MTTLTLNLTRDAEQHLERMRRQTDAPSVAEVIRRALTVYDTLRIARERGAVVVVEDGTTDVGRELLLPEFPAPLVVTPPVVALPDPPPQTNDKKELARRP